jgi:hypothetical protein
MSFELLEDGVRLDGEVLTFAELGTLRDMIWIGFIIELTNVAFLQFHVWANRVQWT